MLIKNASIYLIQRLDLNQLEERLGAALFNPCGSAEAFSYGFVPVFEDQLLFHSHGHYLAKFTFEKKVLPKSAVDAATRAKADALEEEQGFQPGKKAMKELRERVTDELLVRALTTRSSTLVWIDTKAKRLVIDSTSSTMVDRIITALIKHADADLAHCRPWPARELGRWLADQDDELPPDFTIDDAVKLEYPGDRGTEVVYRKADINTPEVLNHLSGGALVLSMAMTYKDRLSFIMTPLGQVRGLKALDILNDVQVAPDVDRFENDFILAAVETSALLDALIGAADKEAA